MLSLRWRNTVNASTSLLQNLHKEHQKHYQKIRFNCLNDTTASEAGKNAANDNEPLFIVNLKSTFSDEPSGKSAQLAANSLRGVSRKLFTNRAIVRQWVGRSKVAIITMNAIESLSKYLLNADYESEGEVRERFLNGARREQKGCCKQSHKWFRAIFHLALNTPRRCGGGSCSSQRLLMTRRRFSRSGCGLRKVWFEPTKTVFLALFHHKFPSTPRK